MSAACCHRVAEMEARLEEARALLRRAHDHLLRWHEFYGGCLRTQHDFPPTGCLELQAEIQQATGLACHKK